MPKSKDYTFTASRRRSLPGAVVIKGNVLAPPGSEPYLIRDFAARPKTRGFRLAFKNNSAEVPFTAHEFEHVEPDVPDFVDTLAIRLPDDAMFYIEHRARR